MINIKEYSKKEIVSMLERGIIGKCSICGELEETQQRWPIHNVIECTACRKERELYGRKKKRVSKTFSYYK